ncbi:MAG: FKBP-type peptidyl-prolyl cis-trans isomerase [Magnetococcales bacterium]|nr:FKBP-type peptidyl-prolyl cis-trans isomerase [Magnetococcales bacterium]NGZ28577.1 FKBP-type peptidyl-prolyl cis-trans isomerase [Magnetococcales bacterium]
MVLLGMCIAPALASAEDALPTPQARYSYIIGLQVGEEMKSFPGGLNVDAFIKGMKVTMENGKALLTPEQVAATKQEFLEKVRSESVRKLAEEAGKNKDAERAFLAENKKKPGVVTTASGLQYMVLTEGSGASPAATDKVSVHYRGTLLDGTEFDSSYTRKEPAVFMVKEVIPGWSEALQLMKEGGKYRLFIPAALAYGQDGVGDVIGPHAMLNFEVELLKVEKAAK